MIRLISSLEEFSNKSTNLPGVVFYFSHKKCNVCKALKPKIYDLLKSDFPKMEMFYCDTKLSPEIAGQNFIFTVPTIQVYSDGKEFVRKIRNIGVNEFKNTLERSYQGILRLIFIAFN